MRVRLPQAATLGCMYFFLTAGAIYGQFVARLPAIKAQTGADEADIGLALLCLGIGAISGFLGVGRLLRHMTSRRMLQVSALALLLVFAGSGLSCSVPLFCALCVLFGFFEALFDVCMNTQGILLEIKTRHSRLSFMHAMYSAGALLGTLLGSLFATLQVPVAANFAICAGLFLCFWRPASGHLHDDLPGERNSARQRHPIPFFIYFCGCMALFAFIVEGSAAEWSGLYLHGVRGASESLAALGFGAFAALMALARLTGDRLREHCGDFNLLLAGTVLATVGMFLVLTPWPALCLLGYGLMGLGLSPVVPVVISRAGQTGLVPPKVATAVVSLCGYSGLLVIPPALGFLAKHLGLERALLLPLFFCFVLIAGSFAFRAKQRGTP